MVCVRLLLSYNISDSWHYAFMAGYRPSYIDMVKAEQIFSFLLNGSETNKSPFCEQMPNKLN